MQQAGVLLALDRLHPPAMGARVSFGGGKPVVRPGPFPESGEVLGGFWVIRVKSRDEAIGWAARCPASENGVIEVRPAQVLSDFPPEVQVAASGFTDLQALARAVEDSGRG